QVGGPLVAGMMMGAGVADSQIALAMAAVGGTGTTTGTGLAVQGGVSKQWVTKVVRRDGTVVAIKHAILADGRRMVERADGSVKIYRQRRTLVISSNPRVGDLDRAVGRLASLTERFAKAHPRMQAAALKMGRSKSGKRRKGK
ncbi:MAG: hypothetical protein AAB368_15295, partial [bacterium]